MNTCYHQTSSTLQTAITLLLLFSVAIASVLVPLIITPLTADAAPIQDQLATKANEDYSSDKFGCFSDQSSANSWVGCAAFAAYWGMKLCMWFAALMSVLLNYAVMELVVGMGLFVGNITGVVVAWQTLRDLVTVFLVFLTIYIGIATILNVSRYGYKTMLLRVILAAIFVNFSITITKVVIDIANITAVQTYQLLLSAGDSMSATLIAQCTKPLDAAAFDKNAAPNVCLNNGIADVFWSKIGIMSIMNGASNGITEDRQWNMLITFVMGIPLFLVLAYVLGAGAFMLLSRFVVLIILIIVSPIGLVAWITGVGSGQINSWWKTLIDQSILAPFLFLCWWIALQVTDGVGKRYNVQGGMTGDQLTTVAGVSIFLNYCIIIGLLLVSLHLTKKLGGTSTNMAMGAYKKTRRMALGATTATAGFVGGAAAVYGGGYLSSKAASAYRNRMATAHEKDETTGEFKNKGLVGATYRKLAGSKLDRGIQKMVEAPSKTGVAGWKSYSTHRDEVQKARSSRKEELNTAAPRAKLEDAFTLVNNARMGGAGVVDPAKLEQAKKDIASAKEGDLAWIRENKPSLMSHNETRNLIPKKQAMAISNRSDVLPDEKRAYQDAAYRDERKALKDKPAPTASPTEVAEIEKRKRDVVRNMTLADLKNNRSLLLSEPNLLAHVSPELYSKFLAEERETASDEDLKKLNTGRYHDIHSALDSIKAAPNVTAEDKQRRQEKLDELRKVLKSKDNLDLELMGTELHENEHFAGALSQAGFEHLTKTKKANFAPEQVTKWNEQRKRYLHDLLGNDTAAAKEFNDMGPKRVAALDATILTDPRVLQHLDPRTLNEITKSDVSKETINTIKENVTRRALEIEQRRQQPQLLDGNGRPRPTPPISREEQNILNLKEWFANPRAKF